MQKENINLVDICNELRHFHVKINPQFLKDLLVNAINDPSPHLNKKLIQFLGMKLTKNTNACLTIYGWTTGKRTIPLEKLIKIIKLSNQNWKTIETNIISIKAGRNGGGEIKINFPIKMDKKLGSIVGHILGDGSIDAKYQQVFFSNSNKELLKEFRDHMKLIFGVDPRIWMQKAPDFGNTQWDKRINSIDELIEGRSCGLFYPTACGQILNFIFKDFVIGHKKKITSTIKTSNKEFKKGLIRAFYDDEGSVGKLSQSIRLFQDNKETLNQFKIFLKDFDITTGDIKIYRKNEKNRYYFDIYRKTNFINYNSKIGFTSSKKHFLLNELCIIKNIKNSK